MAKKKKTGGSKPAAQDGERSANGMVATSPAGSSTAADACGGGCCGEGKPAAVVEKPPVVVEDSCGGGGGCCGGGEEEAPPAPTKPVEDTVEDPCGGDGGCCGGGVEENASPAPVSDDGCATGCCSSTDTVATPSPPSDCCSNTIAPAPVDSCCASSFTKKKKNKPSCCAPKAILVAPATQVKSCCSSSKCSPKQVPKKPSSCAMSERVQAYKSDREAARVKSPAALRAVTVESLRLSIGGMTCSGCCTRIEGFAREQPGILGVNVSLLTSRGVFEYDPAALTPTAIEKLVTTLGFTAAPMPDESLAVLVLHVGRESPLRARQLLLQIDGVAAVRDHSTHEASAAVDTATAGQNSVLVEYDPEVLGARTLVAKLSKAMGGLHVLASTPRPHAIESEEAEVAAFAMYLRWSCLLALPVMFIQYIVPLLSVDLQDAVAGDVVRGLSWADLIGFLCATPILCVLAYPIHESAFLALRFGSRVTMDVLISLSSICAYVFSVVTVTLAVLHLSSTPAPVQVVGEQPSPEESVPKQETFFEVTAILVTLILLGRYIEKIVKVRASHSVDALLQIQAKTAILVGRDSKEAYIDVLLVERGDWLKVLPGARIPTDGVVVEGASSVDESMVTGESRKVPKEVGATVIGGTLNAQGVLVMRVTHTLNESMLARIVGLVDEAQSAKCVSQSVADVVASYFTTFIITVAVVMFVVWYELARNGHVDTQGVAPLPFALKFAITVLVISCPCAISLAVPTAILVASTVGAQSGMLFKGGQAIEALDSVDVVMFDKTGTLTTGALQVVDFLVAEPRSNSAKTNASSNPQINARRLWTLLAAAERDSEHAIAKAVCKYAAKVHTPELRCSQFESIPGCGVRCVAENQTVCVGSLKWMLDVLRVDVPLDLAARNAVYQRDGCVVVCLAVNNVLCALVAMQDAPRPEAQFVIDTLRRQHKIQTWIVTGDQRETALCVAAQLGVPDVTVIADALPHQKVDKVRLLQSIGKRVAFVGDGVNDAPALAMADVGIAIGAGTDVALESAELVLVKDDLKDLLNALALSKATNKLIRWNFTWAFMYNVLMMPLACGALYPLLGWAIPPAFAGLSELLSSVPVILFSLLLNLWKPPFRNVVDIDDQSFVAIDMNQASEKTPLLTK